jgi:hypothetical protein
MTRAALLLLLPALASCVDLEPRATFCATAEPTAPATTPTWHGELAPLFATRCMPCHQRGGNGPMPLTTFDEVAPLAAAIRETTHARRMPPWPPAPCCAEYRDSLALTDAELGLVAAWVDAGAPRGIGAERAPPARPTLAADTTLTMPEPYTPRVSSGVTDDTRCFLLDVPWTEPRFVTGLDLAPGVKAQMHHGLVLTTSAADATRVKALDDADPGPGWSCPGGLVGFIKAGLGGSFFEPQQYEGRGFRVDPGDKVILTMHYSLPASGAFEADQTRVLLRTQAEPVPAIVTLSSFNPAWLVGGMPIAPNTTDVIYSWAEEPGRYAGGRAFDVLAVNLHMHERGKKGGVWILKENGERDCLLQIDAWDHDWQGDYRLATPKRLGPRDRLLVECHFENTEQTQRIVGGVRQQVRWLNWGEDQEMCVGYASVALAE